MSLYSNYLREKTDTLILEDAKGFATYRFTEDQAVYIVDIYVDPDFRKEGVASSFANRIAAIAKEKGITKMYGSVNIGTKQCTDALKVLLAYGFELHSSTTNFLLMSKEI